MNSWGVPTPSLAAKALRRGRAIRCYLLPEKGKRISAAIPHALVGASFWRCLATTPSCGHPSDGGEFGVLRSGAVVYIWHGGFCAALGASTHESVKDSSGYPAEAFAAWALGRSRNG